MLKFLENLFENDISWKELNEKPNVAVFLAEREMYRVEIGGLSFIVIQVNPEEKFGIIALKKQRFIYEEAFQCNVAYCFEKISKSQRDALIKSKIPFLALQEQVYLPFLGVILSDNFKKRKTVKASKMMPATQMLFLYLMYRKEDYILKSAAAEALGFTRTSMTRASEQLWKMGLIEQKKVGKELRMVKKYEPKTMLEAAKSYMINPIQKKIIIRNTDAGDKCLKAGETALSEYSMINSPKIKTVAVYKGALDTEVLEEIDVRWEETDNLIQVEFWKYDPLVFADIDKVDRISLMCSLRDCEDERVEMAIDEMMETIIW